MTDGVAAGPDGVAAGPDGVAAGPDGVADGVAVWLTEWRRGRMVWHHFHLQMRALSPPKKIKRM